MHLREASPSNLRARSVSPVPLALQRTRSVSPASTAFQRTRSVSPGPSLRRQLPVKVEVLPPRASSPTCGGSRDVPRLVPNTLWPALGQEPVCRQTPFQHMVCRDPRPAAAVHAMQVCAMVAAPKPLAVKCAPSPPSTPPVFRPPATALPSQFVVPLPHGLTMTPSIAGQICSVGKHLPLHPDIGSALEEGSKAGVQTFSTSALAVDLQARASCKFAGQEVNVQGVEVETSQDHPALGRVGMFARSGGIDDLPRTPPVPYPLELATAPPTTPADARQPVAVAPGGLRWRSPGRRWCAEPAREQNQDGEGAECVDVQSTEAPAVQSMAADSCPSRSLSPGSEWRRVCLNLKDLRGIPTRGDVSSLCNKQHRQPEPHFGRRWQDEDRRVDELFEAPVQPISSPHHSDATGTASPVSSPTPAHSRPVLRELQSSWNVSTPAASASVHALGRSSEGLASLASAAARVMELDCTSTKDMGEAAATREPSETPAARFSRVRSALARMVSGEAAADLGTSMLSAMQTLPPTTGVQGVAEQVGTRGAAVTHTPASVRSTLLPASCCNAAVEGTSKEPTTCSSSDELGGSAQAGYPDAGAGTCNDDGGGRAVQEAPSSPSVATADTSRALDDASPLAQVFVDVAKASKKAADVLTISTNIADMALPPALVEPVVQSEQLPAPQALPSLGASKPPWVADVRAEEPQPPTFGHRGDTAAVADPAATAARVESLPRGARAASPRLRALTLGGQAPLRPARTAGVARRRTPPRSPAPSEGPGAPAAAAAPVRSPLRARPAPAPSATASEHRSQGAACAPSPGPRVLGEVAGSGCAGGSRGSECVREPAFSAQQLRRFLRSASASRSKSPGAPASKSLRRRNWH